MVLFIILMNSVYVRNDVLYADVCATVANDVCLTKITQRCIHTCTDVETPCLKLVDDLIRITSENTCMNRELCVLHENTVACLWNSSQLYQNRNLGRKTSLAWCVNNMITDIPACHSGFVKSWWSKMSSVVTPLYNAVFRWYRILETIQKYYKSKKQQIQ